MEQNLEIKPRPKFNKEIFKTWYFWRPALAILIGATGGFLYYYFVGCKSGQCAITGNPYMSSIWGGLIGLFVVNSPCSRGRC
jgi:hypothetical protein